MEQIGIEFTPKNYQQTIEVFGKIEASLLKLYGVAEQVGGVFSRMQQGTSAMSSASKQFSADVTSMQRSVAELGKTTNKVFGEMGAAIDKTGKKTGGKGSSTDGGWFGSMGQMGALPFILRWKFYSETLKGMYAVWDDVLMGAGREKIVEPLRDIAVVGFDKAQRRRTEEMGRQHISKFWSAGTQKDYLIGVAEAGSAFDVNDPMFQGKGVEELNKMTQTGAVLAASSRMKHEQAQKLLMAMVHSQMSFLPEAERKKYQGGEKKVSDLAASTAGKVAEIIKLSPSWGKDIDYLMQYAAPSALQRGWKLESLLGVAGAMALPGFRGTKLGRGMKMIMEKETEQYGALWAMSTPEGKAAYLSKTGAEQKEFRLKMGPIMDKLMAKDPLGFFAMAGEWLKSTSMSDESLARVGFAQQWIGQVRALAEPYVLQKARLFEQQLMEISNAEKAKGYVMDAQQDEPGWWKTRLSNAWDGFTQSWSADSPMGKTIEGYIGFLEHMTWLNQGSPKFNWETFLVETKDLVFHGAVMGLFLQNIADMGTALGKLAGVIPKDYQAPNLEEHWEGIKTKLQATIEGAQGFFSKLDKAMEGPATAFGAAIGKIIHLENWNASLLAPKVEPLTPTEDPLAAMAAAMGAGALPTAAPTEGEEKKIVIEVPVQLDGNEIGRATAEYFDKQRVAGGQVWGSGFGSGGLP